MKLSYCVSSLTSFGRLISFKKDDHISKFVTQELKRVHEQVENINLTILFNAFTEPEVGQYYNMLRDKFGMDLDVYTDSGGLQMNLTKTKVSSDIENDKLKIYDVQSKTSKYAMCFDEMPVFINADERTEDMHSRLDATGRYYVSSEVYDKGVATGKNVKKQVEAFKNSNSNTKAIVILQGYTFEDYNTYAKGVYSQLTEEDYPYIGGIAIANTLTISPFDSIDIMMRHQHHLEAIPEEHLNLVHLLGVGGLNRLFPMTTMSSKETYWKRDFICNFDSTTASSSFVFGRFTEFKNGRSIKHQLGYTRTEDTDLFCSTLFKYFKDNLNIHGMPVALTEDEFRNKYTIYNDIQKRKKDDWDEEGYEEEGKFIMLNSFLSIMYELNVFMNMADEVLNHRNFTHLSGVFYKIATIMDREINTIDDYMKYRHHFKKMLSSKKAKLPRVDTLEKAKEEFEKSQILDSLF